jgi:hypothetical protein
MGIGVLRRVQPERSIEEHPHRSLVRSGLLAAATALALFLLVPSAASATALPSVIKENMTLTPSGNPYTGSSTIESGVTVKVEAGVRLSGAALTVKGTLDAEGTAKEPIVLEGKGSGASLAFKLGSGASVIDHVEVSKAGGGSIAAITIEGASPTIRNSVVQKSGSYGISIQGGSPEIAGNAIIKSEVTGIVYSAGAGVTGDVNIHDNLVEGGITGIAVSAASSNTTATALSGNTVVGASGSGLATPAPRSPVTSPKTP